MSKLDILITQYNENETILKPMLDSLNLQQGIIWEDINVYIGNDGSNIKLSNQFISSYNFPIKYIEFPHRGLAGTRQNLFNISSGEYVIFCDADDMFHSTIAIHNILSIIQSKHPDAIVFDFIEECKTQQGQLLYIKHHDDSVFVHGKIYRRQYLIDNNIRWHQQLGCHQDSCFNVFALTLTNNIVKSPFLLYMWKWNDTSISRTDPLHIPKSWCDMIRSYDAIVKDFLVHQIPIKAATYAYWCIKMTYEMMMRKVWHNMNAQEYNDQIYLSLKNFYYDYKILINSLSSEHKTKIDNLIQKAVLAKGSAEYTVSFDEWLENNILRKDEINDKEIS